MIHLSSCSVNFVMIHTEKMYKHPTQLGSCCAISNLIWLEHFSDFRTNLAGVVPKSIIVLDYKWKGFLFDKFPSVVGSPHSHTLFPITGSLYYACVILLHPQELLQQEIFMVAGCAQFGGSDCGIVLESAHCFGQISFPHDNFQVM